MPARVLLYTPNLDENGAVTRVRQLARSLDPGRFQVLIGHFPADNLSAAEKAIREIAPDIFHSFVHQDGVELAAASAAGVPVIIGSRSGLRDWDERRELREWERERNRLTHRIVAATETDAELCEKIEGVSRQNIIVIDEDIAVYADLYEEAFSFSRPVPRVPAVRRSHLRILFHLDYLWLGGLEKRVGNMVLRLDRSRFEPLVSWHRRWGATGAALQNAGVPIFRIAPAHGQGREAAIEQIRALAPDIFHSFSCRLTSADVLNASAAGVPLIVTSRSGLRPPDLGAVHAWEKERNRATHRIVASGETIAASSAGAEGISPDNIMVIPNGVPLAHRDRPCHNGACIGYAATWRALKGHHVLLRAFQKLAARYPDLRLICCGEHYDDTKERIEAEAKALDLDSRATFLDAVEDIREIYRQMDIYVHPSLSEGFSNSILEAMAHGLPVVATAVGGNTEQVIPGETGLLVPPGDAGALAEAIELLLADPALRLRLGQAGYARVKSRFPIEAMVRGYEALYQRLAENAFEAVGS